MTWLAFLRGIVAGIASCMRALVAVALKRGVKREVWRPRTIVYIVYPCRPNATKLLSELRQDEGRRVWS
jgi:hypothetical protein